MGTIAAFPKKEPLDPHIVGAAHCIACAHKWTSVAPVGSVWLECPNCKCDKGLMDQPCVRELPTWTCNCGNDLFHVTKDGYYCPNCGDWQTGF